jgi:1-acyl-sn-glycerol-3-phosphate acyltransferase
MSPSQAASDRSNALVYHAARILIGLFMSVLFRRFMLHRKNVPATGAVLLVANHQSMLDPPLIGTCVSQRRVEYLAKASLFGSLFGRIIGALGAVPVREDGKSDTAAIKEILRRLDAGHAVLVFPEGERTRDGAMHTFKRGAALLVKRSKCPVIAIGIDGCYDAWPRDRSKPRLWGARIGASCGELIAHDELMQDGTEAALSRLFNEVDQLRLEARAELRRRTRGRFPPPGPGDGPNSQPVGHDADEPRHPNSTGEQDD